MKDPQHNKESHDLRMSPMSPTYCSRCKKSGFELSHEKCPVSDPQHKETWRERFDEIGFKNQAVIKGMKRVELKAFINQELAIQRTKDREVEIENLIVLLTKFDTLFDQYHKDRKLAPPPILSMILELRELIESKESDLKTILKQ